MLFSQLGLHATPTSKIAEEANVSNGTLFNYFKTKDDLIIELYSNIKSELNGSLAIHIRDKDPIKTKIKTVFCYAFDWGSKNEEKMSFLQFIATTPNLDFIPNEVRKQQSFLHKSLLEEAVKQKVIRNLPIELISELASGHFFSAMPYIRKTPPRNRKESIELVFELFWNMIKV